VPAQVQTHHIPYCKGVHPSAASLLSNSAVSAQRSQDKDRIAVAWGKFLQVVLVALRADAYHQDWSHLLHHISPAQATVRQLQGHCFRKLILGTNMLLDAFWNEWTNSSGCACHCLLQQLIGQLNPAPSTHSRLHVYVTDLRLVLCRFDDATLALRKPALHAAQRFLMSSALTHKLQHLRPGEDRARMAAEGCSRIADTAAMHANSPHNTSSAGASCWCIQALLTAPSKS
jgi:hypothetical protein